MRKLFFVGGILTVFLISCGKDDIIDDPRQAMREFVIGISTYAKSTQPDFVVIPQNGVELVSTNGEEDGAPHGEYLNAIDANGQEDLFYGYNRDDRATPGDENSWLRAFLDISKNAGNTILVTDYCSTHSNMDDSYYQNHVRGYVSFAADHRELDHIPGYPDPVYSENNLEITSLSEVQNFLYLINPENFSSKVNFIDAVTSTNYDLLIMDLFFNDNSEFSPSEVEQLRVKANGGSRLVVAYMSIGEAEDYRYYWEDDWSRHEPSWLDKENPDWEGNYKVKYWDPEWQAIIYGNDDSYLKRILDAGFDGVYLDIIDAYEYYE